MLPVDLEKLTEQLLAHDSLVRKLASRHLRPGIPLDDLMQEGRIGLMKAIQTFNPERGAKFETWAWIWINDALERCIWRETQSIGLPHREYQFLRQLHAVKSKLCQELQREPSIGELATEMSLSEARVKDLLSISQLAVPLDELNLDKADPHMPLWTDPSQADDLEKRELSEKFRGVINGLSPREQFILAKHHGLGRENKQTLQEIAIQLGISAPRVNQIEKLAVEKIRAQFSRL